MERGKRLEVTGAETGRERDEQVEHRGFLGQ